MKYVFMTIFCISAILGIWLIAGKPFLPERDANTSPQTRIITPRSNPVASRLDKSESIEQEIRDESSQSKIALAEGEILISVITQDFDGDMLDEQLLALRMQDKEDRPIYLAWVAWDASVGGYRRIFEIDTSVTHPRTFSFNSRDLIGDRSVCIVCTGLNSDGQQTMTVFHQPISLSNESTPTTLKKIADIQTDGSVVVLERERSQAYQTGLSKGEAFQLASYDRDTASSNMLDQIETRYSWNPLTGVYDRSGTAKIPGIQIEQRRVREILDGTAERFERFLSGLWYYVSGTETDEKRFLYFDPQNREIIFYIDNTQEVYSWRSSNSTRYGLYITTYNTSLSTLRRVVDIELFSADTIRMKVFEDVNLKISFRGRLDGTYRKSTGSPPLLQRPNTPVREIPVEGLWEGTRGSIKLSNDAAYTLLLDGIESSGRWTLYTLDTHKILELRQNIPDTQAPKTYLVEFTTTREESSTNTTELHLSAIKTGVRGIEQLHESDLVFERKGE